MPKKIAFIGDSHFSPEDHFNEESGVPSNWTWQLSQRFPQHTYYNYSRGGQSIEYFQRALVDAKKRGCDIVFLVKTHTGRMFVDWEPIEERKPPTYTWKETNYIFNDQETNYNVMNPEFQGFWLVPGEHDYFGHGIDLDFDKNLPNVVKFAESYRTYIAPSASRKEWEMAWYNSAPDVYNFENLFLVNWKFNKKNNHSEDEVYSNLPSTVQDILLNYIPEDQKFLDTLWSSKLYNNGLSLAEDDDHLTYKGHQIVLEKLILSDDTVLNALNS
jgi:hypothetical protein